MRIESQGSVIALHTEYELVLVGPHACRIAVKPKQYCSPSEGAPQELMPAFDRLQLALSPSGTRVATNLAGEGLHLIDIASRQAARSTAEALAFITDDELLSVRCLDGTLDEWAVYRGPFGSPPTRLSVAAAEHVAWPGGQGRMWKSEVRFEEGALTGGVIASNQFGHAVADARSGLIVAMRADGYVIAHRVPSEGAHSEITLAAVPTREGFLVLLGGGRSVGVVNHFATDGSHLGAMNLFGNVSGAHVVDDLVILARETSDYSGNVEVVVASLPTLAIREVIPTKVSTYRGYPGFAARDGGRELWIGTEGANVHRLVRAASGWQAHRFDIDEIPLVELIHVSARDLTTHHFTAPPSTASGANPVVPRDVVHAKFGRGKVIAQEGSGEQAKLKIEFADGTRTLLAKFVSDR